MTLVDTNLLLYAYHSNSVHHKPARLWLETTLSAPQPVRVAWVSLLAFLRISTDTRMPGQTFLMAEAISIANEWLALPNFGILSTGPRHWEILASLLADSQSRGPLVTDAHIADFLIVAARGRGRGEAAVCLLVVPRDLPGVTITQLRSIDQTRRPCEVVFRGVDLPRHASLAEEGKGWKVLQRLLDAAAVILSADCLGGAQRSLEMAVDYSKVREQFGRPIGSFQAVKHIAAEMVSEIEPARSLVWYAAYAYTAEPGRAAVAASMAKARLSDVYARSANRAVQVHGGIGFTWEHDMHLWFKRAKWNESAFGDATYHRERVAKLADF